MSLEDPSTANLKKKKRVAIVLANPALSTTSWPIGFGGARLLVQTLGVRALAGYSGFVSIFAHAGA